MKILFAFVLVASSLPSILTKVIVQDGDYTFPLEDVKQLWALMDTQAKDNPAVASSASTGLCHSSELPKTFQSVCTSKDADQVFLRLGRLAQQADSCEICSQPACSGCEIGGIKQLGG
ncbi:guanylin-like [Hemitrygon akajei]|uniref:guanylin-like n=1 Tax=Hemitrygon akajei TaxID=2704970 RepID=UPI003BF9E658